MKKKTEETSTDNRRKVITVEGQYSILKSATSDLSINDIDAIAKEIEENGLTLNTACTVSGIEFNSINNLLQYHNKSETNRQLKEYAENAFKIAQAKFEQKLTKIILDKEQFNPSHVKAVERFLEIVSPRFSRQNKQMYKYDLVILLKTIKTKVDEDTFITILEALKDLDPYNCVADVDDMLL